MDPTIAFIALRMAERISGVFIGALLVLLGYSLFLKLPDLQDANGSLKLPKGVSVYLSNIGPGAFFAMFGCLIVALSLVYGMDFEQRDALLPASAGAAAPAAVITNVHGMVEAASTGEAQTPTRQEIRDVVVSVAALNRVPADLKPDLPPSEQAALLDKLRTAKLQLMRSVWNESWGDRATFQAWVEQGADPGADNAAAVNPTAIVVFSSLKDGE